MKESYTLHNINKCKRTTELGKHHFPHSNDSSNLGKDYQAMLQKTHTI